VNAPTDQPIDIARLLAHEPKFIGLGPDKLARLAAASRLIHAAKGRMLFRKGDPCTGIHVLIYGQVKLAFTSANGNEKIVEIVDQGQSFGEAIMLMDQPHAVFAQTLRDSFLLHVARQAVIDELEHDHDFCRKMLTSMAWRLNQLMSDVESYSLHSGKQRVIDYLLCKLPDRTPNDLPVVVPLQVSKGVLASRLSLTQEHFSRILHELAEAGLIAVAGRNIHIPSVGRLRGQQAANGGDSRSR